jgi:hypothetical protein
MFKSWGMYGSAADSSAVQSIHPETFLPLGISVDFIRSITRQMSELVEILSNRHVYLLQCKKHLLL